MEKYRPSVLIVTDGRTDRKIYHDIAETSPSVPYI